METQVAAVVVATWALEKIENPTIPAREVATLLVRAKVVVRLHPPIPKNYCWVEAVDRADSTTHQASPGLLEMGAELFTSAQLRSLSTAASRPTEPLPHRLAAYRAITRVAREVALAEPST